MPFVPVPNTALVEIRMSADLQLVENTLYFELAEGWAAPAMNDLGALILAWWETNIRPNVWGGLSVREVVITDLETNTGPQVTVVPVSPLTGALNEAPLPTSVSLTVSFRTDLRGRSFRGRNYIVGLVESQTIGANIFDTEVLDNFKAAYDALPAATFDVGATWVVVSRFSGIDGNGQPIPRVSGVTTPITTVVIVDNVVDSQRRRLPGRGT